MLPREHIMDAVNGTPGQLPFAQTSAESRRLPGDLRSWLEAIEAKGLLTRVRKADAHLEIGEITEINNTVTRPKALLFEDIPGVEGRVLSSAASAPSTLAETLGFDVADTASLVERLRGGRLTEWFERARNETFEWVEDGPVAANCMEGAAVDISKFPAPKWRGSDGGRYIGTGCVVITQDPVSGTYNGGAYRTMVLDKDRVTILMAAESRHGRQHQLKYRELGKPCPIVISLGHDPLFSILGGLEVPEGTFELDVAGAILGQRCRMLRGRVTGLPIPADAELVIEGWLTDDEAPEGPFGEFLGYYAGGERPCPVVKIEAVYYRDNPIVLGSPPGKPPHDMSYYWSVMRSALIHDQIQGAGVPDVKAVWADEVGGARLLITVAIKQRYFGHSRQAGFIASQCHGGVYLGRYVVVVDDDIDPSDLREVMWAVVSRTDPTADIVSFTNSLGSGADPMKGSYEPGTMYSSRAIIDACRPYKNLSSFPKVAATPKDKLEAVRQKWSSIWS
jgi:UbiD family decarboxylase